VPPCRLALTRMIGRALAIRFRSRWALSLREARFGKAKSGSDCALAYPLCGDDAVTSESRLCPERTPREDHTARPTGRGQAMFFNIP
jgi:hypothetical protein